MEVSKNLVSSTSFGRDNFSGIRSHLKTNVIYKQLLVKPHSVVDFFQATVEY